ncbi:transcriptional regulator LeuO [Aliivibrio fischeri]|uniref:transcriptional regulator LeuO n=1 Tax=Aliivibrio fischeri TaxID=668 RepID=UPI0006D27E0F|nr:transcriptional regulator LeuO [Aliivibrio fischeri]MUH98169.1 transcriptional regulator LeuO [Aliivibrio fischeri]MUI64484.1 transcriptional regulator LeuO [Aliivibrio fischeri]USR95202.1 transcriptional regulator LeuO [Aliivibrio fischeri ATCC 7744 = JCM 18803 = DSM 507]GGK28150.1 transcriptional regulator LeuO [Aliivibrio fischeri]
MNTPETSLSSVARTEQILRGVDLNLLTVFDAVMQEQNITRAAQNLGMSQPAVSNAVSRLKLMFNDELFIRHGRGIQPTQRARQLFAPMRQALQLVKNELPSSTFSPETSMRQFKLSICSPSDIRFAPRIMKDIQNKAPHISLKLSGEHEPNIAQKLRYQEVDFVIDYVRFDEPGFMSTELFTDELVVVASVNHPRLQNGINKEQLASEKHAVPARIENTKGFADHLYTDSLYEQAYKGASISNILYVVSQSELITVAPKWLVNSMPNRDQLIVLPLPIESKGISGYLSWHDSYQKDKGHIWMRDQLMLICGEEVVASSKGMMF